MRIPGAMTFAQRPSGTSGANGITQHEGITCYWCNKAGRYASDCPNDTSSTASSTTLVLQYWFTLAQGVCGINHLWIYLDLQSTISVFCNPDMSTNIRPSDHVLRAANTEAIKTLPLLANSPTLDRFGPTLTQLPTHSPSQKSARVLASWWTPPTSLPW